MSQIIEIREAYALGKNISQIARELKFDEKTVRKYLSIQDFSPIKPIFKPRKSRLDPFKTKIQSWIDADALVWHKQRHTAQRIFDRLKSECPDFTLSYPTVQRFVRSCKAKHLQTKTFQELIWHPGEAQVDFGEADFYENAQLCRKKYLVVSFPHSNQAFYQIFGGETSECVCQGLLDIFNHIGGVAPVLVFDNATGVGRRIIREAKLFKQMRAHYGFMVRFCNPQSGHEKGNVENKVGTLRRNLFVPIPSYDSLKDYNRGLLEQTFRHDGIHYKKGKFITELFEDDRQALKALPMTPFNVCRYLHVKADSYGKVRIDAKHFYSTCPELGGAEILVGIKAHDVEIYEEHGALITVHRRRFGQDRTDSLDYRTTLATLTKSIGAWKNSGVREIIPPLLREHMDGLCREELKKAVQTLSRLSKTYSFETAVSALGEGFRIKRTGFCDAAALAARMMNFGLDTPAEQGPDLTPYDQLLKMEVGA